MGFSHAPLYELKSRGSRLLQQESTKTSYHMEIADLNSASFAYSTEQKGEKTQRVQI